MELLLRKKAEINSLNNGGCSSLHVAVNKQHFECAKILLRYKCNVNIQVSRHDALRQNEMKSLKIVPYVIICVGNQCI